MLIVFCVCAGRTFSKTGSVLTDAISQSQPSIYTPKNSGQKNKFPANMRMWNW